MRLFNAFPNLKEPTKTKGVVLVDEIGLHLHPLAQRKIVEQLRTFSPNIQFIVTSHSPFIANASEKGEVFTLENQKGSTQLKPFDGSLKCWRLIIESGLKDEVSQIPGAYLQLAEKNEQRIELGNMKMTDVPANVAISLQAKMNELQEIIKNSGILDKLEAEGVHLDLHVAG